MGVGSRYINRTGCIDVYTNYVRIYYRCYTPTGKTDMIRVYTQGGHPPGKPGKVGEFIIGQGKLGEIVVACGVIPQSQ